jgi:integral membrane protein (TIGR01906 family)
VVLLALMANLFILSLSIDVFSLGRSYYDSEFEKLGTAEITGLTTEELGTVSEMIIGYLKGQIPDFQATVIRSGEERQLFNEREQSHMVDVLELFQLNARVKVITVAGFFLAAFVAVQLAGDKKILYHGLIASGVLGLLATGLLLMMVTLDFTKYFTLFHELFFDNDLWLLDPRTDLLIVILQEQFFVDIAIRIFGLYVALNAAIAAIGSFLKYRGIHRVKTDGISGLKKDF